MCEIIGWLNSNEGTTNAILSVVSLLISCTAIVISISTSKRQIKINLFEKRYEVYSRFSELINMANLVSSDSLTYKGKIMIFNCEFFGLNTESSNIGSEIFIIDEKLQKTAPESEEYKFLSEERNEKARKKFALDYVVLVKDETILEKSRLIFHDNFANDIKEFFRIYSDIVMFANFSDEKNMNELFEQWHKVCDKLHNKKYLEKMEKYIKTQ